VKSRLIQSAAILAGIGYLAVFAWATTTTTYDVWGALVVLPPLALIGVVVIRSMFAGTLEQLRPLLYLGLVVKLVGTALRYWVGFEAYGGSIDAQRYHRYAVQRSADVRDGVLSVFDVIPSGTGTPYVEEIVAFIYTLTGPSKMGGFVVFGLIGYLGVICFVKAACIAVPGLATHRYAALCVLAPSLAYWPSSIGKEALMILGLGIGTLGVAKFFATGAVLGPVVTAAAGFAFTAAVRPHMAGLWLAGVVPALLVMFVRNLGVARTEERRRTHQGLMLVVIGVAAIGLVVSASAAVRYLPGADDEGGESVSSILEETTRRTSKARSSFDPPNVNNPVNWPYAAVRTLTRPLLIEARGSAQLFTALELTLLMGLAVVSHRRLLHLPKLVLTVPFVTFAMTVLFLGALAFSSFANLGVLARQKALVFPFLLLIVCVPALPRRREHDPGGERSRRRAELLSDRSGPERSGKVALAPSKRASRPVTGTAGELQAPGPVIVTGTVLENDDLWAPRRRT
jgi:hypothetical protein